MGWSKVAKVVGVAVAAGSAVVLLSVVGCADDPAPWQPDVQPFPRATWTTESPAPAGEFVLVPAGEFWMGSNSWLADAHEVTTEVVYAWRHRVTISRPMWVGVVEVTRAEWFAVFPDDPRAGAACHDMCPAAEADFVHSMEHWPEHNVPQPCSGACPMNDVSLFEAMAYASARSVAMGLDPCYDLSECEGSPGVPLGLDCTGPIGKQPLVSDRPVVSRFPAWNRTCKGFRVPTKAEFEYFADGGHDWDFGCGDVESDSRTSRCGWLSGMAYTHLRPGGLLLPNDFGIYDTLGNVAEWTWDAMRDYPKTPEVDPAYDGSGDLVGAVFSRRITSGGAAEDRVWTTAPYFQNPTEDAGGRGFLQDVGLRLVRNATCAELRQYGYPIPDSMREECGGEGSGSP
jgi:formylglycine-generating enzyme required for sulfatase activity